MNKGVSIGQLLTGTIPKPTIRLEWAEDIGPENMARLEAGETAVLHGADGKPYAHILMDYYGTLREKRLTPDSTSAATMSTQNEHGAP